MILFQKREFWKEVLFLTTLFQWAQYGKKENVFILTQTQGLPNLWAYRWVNCHSHYIYRDSLVILYIFQGRLWFSRQNCSGIAKSMPISVFCSAIWEYSAAPVAAAVQFGLFFWPSCAVDSNVLQMVLWHLTAGSTVTVIYCSVHKKYKVQMKW